MVEVRKKHAGASSLYLRALFVRDTAGEKVYPDEVQEVLDDGLDAFETVADDGSSREVGTIICGLYNDIAQGNFATANHQIQLAQTTQSGASTSVYGKTETDDEDDDDEGDDEEGVAPTAGGMESAAMDEDHEMAAPVGPVVDEDGFTMVTSKKKGGRR